MRITDRLGMGEKRCRLCTTWKPREAFSKDKSRPDGLATRCKPCDAARAAEWQRTNPERKRQHRRRWREKQKQRSAARRIAPQIAKLKKVVAGLTRDSQHETGLRIELVTTKLANQLLTHHYLGPLKFSPSFCFSTADDAAVAVYSPPIASHFKNVLPGSLELARLWRRDGAPFHTSKFLSATLRWLRAHTDCPVVVTYADPAQGHDGTVYRATGFLFLGGSRTTDGWQTPDGGVVSSPQCYRRFKTKSRTKIQELNPTWKLLPGVPKRFFVFPLRKGRHTTLLALGRQESIQP